MRIVAGQYGGRKLDVPKGRDIRPTSDKIRGAVFNMLESRGAVVGAQVLDAFCGTGALGLEALSRGASHCIFTDNSKESLILCRGNADKLGVLPSCSFVHKDATQSGFLNGAPRTLVFLDPPYGQGLVPRALAALHDQKCLADGALCVLETEKEFAEALPQEFEVFDERIYGDTKIILAEDAAVDQPEQQDAE